MLKFTREIALIFTLKRGLHNYCLTNDRDQKRLVPNKIKEGVILNVRTTAIFSMFLVILIFATACSSNPSTKSTTKDIDKYEQFMNAFVNFKKNFSSQNFVSISQEDVNIKTTSFPEHHFGTSKADAIDNNVMKPIRLETYYKSNLSPLLVKVDFIYMPNAIEDSFITISTISNKDNTNIEEQYQNIERPLLDDYYLTMNGMLIVIKFFDTSATSDQETYDNKYNAFIEQELLFYQDFEKAILNQDR